MSTQLQPYIFFYGRCEDALEFYKAVFGGSYEMMRVADAPMTGYSPPGTENKVMHASFTSGPIAFLASDGREAKTVDPDAGNISLALDGSVQMPIRSAFWGGRFGSVVDKFGTEWLMTLP